VKEAAVAALFRAWLAVSDWQHAFESPIPIARFLPSGKFVHSAVCWAHGFYSRAVVRRNSPFPRRAEHAPEARRAPKSKRSAQAGMPAPSEARDILISSAFFIRHKRPPAVPCPHFVLQKLRGTLPDPGPNWSKRKIRGAFGRRQAAQSQTKQRMHSVGRMPGKPCWKFACGSPFPLLDGPASISICGCMRTAWWRFGDQVQPKRYFPVDEGSSGSMTVPVSTLGHFPGRQIRG